MLQPLVRNVITASYGVTVLETTASYPVRDSIAVPGGRPLLVPLGGFSHASRLRNLRSLLGPRYVWRILFPVRGSADVREESCPVLNDAFASDVRAALQEAFAKVEATIAAGSCAHPQE